MGLGASLGYWGLAGVAFPLLWRVVAPPVAGVGVVSPLACSAGAFSSPSGFWSSWGTSAAGWLTGSTASAGASYWTGSTTSGWAGAACGATPFSWTGAASVVYCIYWSGASSVIANFIIWLILIGNGIFDLSRATNQFKSRSPNQMKQSSIKLNFTFYIIYNQNERKSLIVSKGKFINSWISQANSYMIVYC